jgi:aspartate/methionine/tyrosine aminotransferase
MAIRSGRKHGAKVRQRPAVWPGGDASAPVLRETTPRLPEKTLIEAIDTLASRWRDRHGREPVHVSHWNPSDAFANSLRGRLPARLDPCAALAVHDPVPYRHSHALPDMAAVLGKLGVDSGHAGALIAENGTTCIAAVANWLKLNGVAEVTLLAPYYFTTPHNLRRLGIAVREVPCKHGADGYRLPDLDLRRGQALWLTNPIYSTGVYAPERSCESLRRLADAGVLIVADEAMALRPTALARELGGHRNFVGIYTPHKSICMNGIKFSAIVSHPCHQPVFADWAEVLSGALSLAAVAAVEHFLDPGFDDYRAVFLALTREARRWHDGLVERCGGAIALDAQSEGHFLMVYVPALPARIGDDIGFLSEVLERTGCTLVPGTRSGFDARRGFCFRVNLAQDCLTFREALPELYGFLRALSRAPAAQPPAVVDA